MKITEEKGEEEGDEYRLRSLVELDDVGDSGTTFMKPTDINNGREVLY